MGGRSGAKQTELDWTITSWAFAWSGERQGTATCDGKKLVILDFDGTSTWVVESMDEATEIVEGASELPVMWGPVRATAYLHVAHNEVILEVWRELTTDSNFRGTIRLRSMSDPNTRMLLSDLFLNCDDFNGAMRSTVASASAAIREMAVSLAEFGKGLNEWLKKSSAPSA